MVLVTMALVVAIAAPRYASSVARYRAEAAARRVAADLSLAQTQAKAGSKPQTVTFNTGNATYTAAGLTGPDNRPGGYTVDLSASPYRAVITSANFGGQAQVTFDAYGGVVTNNLFTTGSVVVTAGSMQKTVSVDAGTGKITVQ
jgi:Tfp pilus assembly protein FimT